MLLRDKNPTKYSRQNLWQKLVIDKIDNMIKNQVELCEPYVYPNKLYWS
jgi:hypothetical protein